jgi:diphosphomevalonate decarboxylase
MKSAIAHAFPNIAFIKYWGDRDAALRIPTNGSISMNLDGLYTRTEVSFSPENKKDTLTINAFPISGPGLRRVGALLERVRQMAGISLFAQVTSQNNFPVGAGLASSASAFAALSLAASAAVGLQLSEKDLSRLARTGSGSACRSVPGGFVEWQAGENDADSFAFSIAPPDHWPLTDCIAIVSQAHKFTGSTEGHARAHTSPLQAARQAEVPRLLVACRRAILERDFEALAVLSELDCHLMHAVMMTSSPPLFYWQPTTLSVMQAVRAWRRAGLPVCYTIDAGPNVHVICEAGVAAQVSAQLGEIPGVPQILVASPGGPARLEIR